MNKDSTVVAAPKRKKLTGSTTAVFVTTAGETKVMKGLGAEDVEVMINAYNTARIRRLRAEKAKVEGKAAQAAHQAKPKKPAAE